MFVLWNHNNPNGKICKKNYKKIFQTNVPHRHRYVILKNTYELNPEIYKFDNP